MFRDRQTNTYKTIASLAKVIIECTERQAAFAMHYEMASTRVENSRKTSKEGNIAQTLYANHMPYHDIYEYVHRWIFRYGIQFNSSNS